MSKFFLILSAFALIVSTMVCVSHAHASVVNTDSEISVSIDAESLEDTSLSDDGCDMACGGCCVHHAMDTAHYIDKIVPNAKETLSLPHTNLFVSDYIYGLKRPPKS